MIQSLQLVLFSAFLFAFLGKTLFYTNLEYQRGPTNESTEMLSLLSLKDEGKKSLEFIKLLNQNRISLDKIIKEFDSSFLNPKAKVNYLSLANTNKSLENFLSDSDNEGFKSLKDLIENKSLYPLINYQLNLRLQNEDPGIIQKSFRLEGVSEQRLGLTIPFEFTKLSEGELLSDTRFNLNQWKKREFSFRPFIVNGSKVQERIDPLSSSSVIQVRFNKLPPSQGAFNLDIEFGSLETQRNNITSYALGLNLNQVESSLPLQYKGLKEDYELLIFVKKIGITLNKEKEFYQMNLNSKSSSLFGYQYKSLDKAKDLIAFIKDGYKCENTKVSSKPYLSRVGKFTCWKKNKVLANGDWSKVLVQEAALILRRF